MKIHLVLRRVAKYAAVGFCLMLTVIVVGMTTVDYVLSNKAYHYVAKMVTDSGVKERVHRAFNAKYPLRTQMFAVLGQNPLRMENIIRLVWAGGP